MSITTELREFVDGLACHKSTRDLLCEIADRIDAAHQKAEDEWKAKDGQAWLHGYAECRAELMEGNEAIAADLEKAGWIRLPKDADGEAIHIGDVMEWPDGSTFEVVGIGDGTLYYVEGDGADHAEWTVASTKRHHHAPTVEDVLREFAERVCDSGHQWGLDAADTIAEYATKLRLAGEGA